MGFSEYRVISIVVLAVAIIVASMLVKGSKKPMYTAAADVLGALMLVSSVSYFVGRLGGDENPTTPLDSLVQAQCDCGRLCKAGVIVWIVFSLATMLAQWLYWSQESKK